MKIYSVLQIGEYHLNHCEDYLFIGEIGDNKTVCAVMDGCTMGIDSYFVSTLVGKLLRKITKAQGYKEFYGKEKCNDPDECLKSILKELFKELVITSNQLMLGQKELLSTLILLLIDNKTGNGLVLIVGDGLICINGTITEFDQDNKPDYLGFHLHEEFELWYSRQNQKIAFTDFSDISIATDGIYMFTSIKKAESNEIINPIEFLVKDREGSDNSEMLQLKLNRLEHHYGIKPSDDLAIVRLIAG